MTATIIAIVHTFDYDCAIELCRTVELAKQSMRSIIVEHFSSNPPYSDLDPAAECLAELDDDLQFDHQINMTEGCWIEMRELDLPELVTTVMETTP